MNARVKVLNIAVAALFLAASSGCVVNTTKKPHNGNITLLWSFGGKKCFEVQAVTRVQVSIPGQTLADNGNYPCTSNNIDGITLLNFAPGTYAYTVQGVNDAGAVFYTGQGSVTIVDGNASSAIDLTASAGAPAYAYVTWSFPQVGGTVGPSCAQAGVSTVVISVDGAQAQSFDCAQGLYGTGAVGVLVTTVAGTHSIDISAADAQGFYYFRKVSSLPALVTGSSVSASYTLDWNAGSLPVRWSFFASGAADRSCAYVGATQVRIDLKDSQGNFVYGTDGTLVDCTTSGVQGTTFLYLYPDTYRIYVQAFGSGGILYKSNQTTPPTAVVTAGSFPVVSSATPAIVMQ